MKQSKLLQVLRQLDKKEQKRFGKYLHSPFFNKHADVLALYELLLEFAPNFEDERLQTSWVLDQLQQQRPDMTAKQLHHVNSYCLELLSDFIAYTEWEQDPIASKYYSLRGFRKRSLTKQSNTIIRQYQQLQNRQNNHSARQYFQQYQFFDELDARFLEQQQRIYDDNLQLKNNYLDVFYLSAKLKLACDMASRNIVIKADYECYLMEVVQPYLSNDWERYAAYPTIEVYYKLWQLLTQPQQQSYADLKACLLRVSPQIAPNEAKEMYDYAENYCIRQINSGQSTYYKEFLDLYKSQLDLGLLFKGGYLEERDYKNIVTAGIRLKDYVWTERFIRSNKKYLKEEVQENAFIYNLAALYYAKRQYTQALRSLHAVEFTDITYHLGAKDIQLKSYYELNESEAFIALCHAFRIYVLRNRQLSEYRKEVYLNYLKLVKRIEALRNKQGFLSKSKFKKEWEGIAQELETTVAVANSDWLQTIFQELQPS